MSRQNPFEGIIQQTLHGFDLFRPGIPAGVPESIEMSAPVRKGEVISGEEVFASVQETAAAARVAGNGNRHQFLIQNGELRPVEKALRFPERGTIALMNPALAPEPCVVNGLIRHVVAVGQKHPPYASQAFETPDQRRGFARRIDEDVSFRARQKVRRGPEAFLAVIAAVQDFAVDIDRNGKLRPDAAQTRIGPFRSNGSRGTGRQGQQRLMSLRRRLRLRIHRALSPDGGKNSGSQRAAGVAIDAGLVHVKIAGNIFHAAAFRLGHFPFPIFPSGNPKWPRKSPPRCS